MYFIRLPIKFVRGSAFFTPVAELIGTYSIEVQPPSYFFWWRYVVCAYYFFGGASFIVRGAYHRRWRFKAF
jgi:hypothetical protein